MQLRSPSNAREYYDAKIDSAKSVGEAMAYGSKKSRLMRYLTASRLPFLDCDSWHDSTLLDLGCGAGHFAYWLENHYGLNAPANYIGIDPNPKMVNMAVDYDFSKKDLDKHSSREFALSTIFGWNAKYGKNRNVDWIAANCIFGAALQNGVHDTRVEMLSTIQVMFDIASKGICFDLFYCDDGDVSYRIYEDKEHGYLEWQVSPEWIYSVLKDVVGHPRCIIDASSSDKYFTVYMYKRPQIYERFETKDLESGDRKIF